jgi:uncharacterized protein YcfL
MVESAEKQRERRMKRRREAEARGEELRGRGRPKAAVGLVVQDAGRRSSQLELDAKVAAGLKLEYGGALRAAESVAEARVMLRAHADKLAEMAYDYWLDARGVVHQRLVPAQRLLLRTAHVNNLSALARKVHNHSGRQMRCLSFKPVTGGNVKVGLLAELLRVVQSYVVRGILVELRYVMLNGLCGAACADGDGASVRPLCAALEGLARACASVGRPLHGVNWAEVKWSEGAADEFARALARGHIPKYQVTTCGEAVQKQVRDYVRTCRQAHEAACRECGEVPWWRDPTKVAWMEVKDTAHKCMQGFGCGSRAPKMGSTKALWWQ